MSSRLKVTHVINNLEIGGAEIFLKHLLEELSKKEIDLTVICLEKGGPVYDQIINIPRVKVKIFNYSLFTPYLGRFDLFIRPRLLLYILKNRPDIIHGHLFKGEDFAKVLGLIFRIPVVTTSHDTLIWPGRKSLFLNKALCRAVAVSDVVASHLKKAYKLPTEKIVVIPNALKIEDLELGFKKFNKQKPVFLYIGRIMKEKGVEDAIRGIALLKKEFPKIEFLIFGKEVFKGEERKLSKLIEKNNWNFIKLMGRTDDVPMALAKGDIFLSPSKSEGFGLSVLEAAASKRAIIATETGIIPDIVRQGISGELVSYGNPQDIYLAARNILKNNLVSKYGGAAYQIAKKCFSIGKVADLYYNLYLSLRSEKN